MQTRLDDEKREWLRSNGKKSLFFLARAILGFSDLDKDIHRELCRAIQDYKNNTRLLVIFPRTWFKSTIVSVAYPIWRAINDPNVRILVVQNSHSNACKKLSAIRDVFEKNALFKALYPEILPGPNDTWKAECLTVNRTISAPEGTFEAAGTGTAVTSRHYDAIIEDDTIAPEKDSMTGIVQQPTQLEVEKAIGWHRLAFPLMLHPSKSQNVVVGTRWADRDLLGWVMENQSEYKVLARAALEDGEGKPANWDSGGQPVWERFDAEVIKALEKAEGPYMFASLYLNMPTAAINQVFKREWIQYWATMPETARLVCCTSVDPASAEKEESSDPDYTVVLTTAINPADGQIYVLHYTRARLNPGETVQAIFDHHRIHNPVVIKVESISYQRTLNYWIKKRQTQLGQHFYIEEIRGWKTSKEDRIRALQPYFAAGKISLKTGMTELEHELLAFPKSAHDDVIDALSVHLDFWNNEVDMYREEKKKDYIASPFSGATIIEELMKRPRMLRSYPADVGLMRDRMKGRQLREYSYG